MSLTVADLNTNFNTFVGDSSTDRISANERLQYATEAVVWLQEETENDHSVSTYDLNFYDGVHYYKITTAVADLLSTADLRRQVGENYFSFTPKSSRELVEDIAQGSGESAFAIERRDSQVFLVVNHDSKYPSKQVASFDSTTTDSGEWELDSDATNLTVDTVEYSQGTASLNFDIDVSASANNRATIVNSTMTSIDLSEDINISAWLLDVWIPDVTNFSSVTIYWGTDSSNYWSGTATTDMNGYTFTANEKNTVKVNWADATMTGTPDEADITYVRIDFNYTGSQTDDTDFRVDNLRVARPEKLKFYYLSSYVGTDTNGTDIRAFTATTDIPYFSGQYDNYKFPVAHKMASLAYRGLRLYAEADQEEAEALKSLRRLLTIVPSSVAKESKNFKVRGISFRRNRR